MNKGVLFCGNAGLILRVVLVGIVRCRGVRGGMPKRHLQRGASLRVMRTGRLLAGEFEGVEEALGLVFVLVFGLLRGGHD